MLKYSRGIRIVLYILAAVIFFAAYNIATYLFGGQINWFSSIFSSVCVGLIVALIFEKKAKKAALLEKQREQDH